MKIAAVWLIAMAGCDRNPDTVIDPAGPGPSALGQSSIDAPDTGTPAPVLRRDAGIPLHGDAPALGLLSAINDREIALARQAQEKRVGDGVLIYALLLEEEHRDSQTRTFALGGPLDSPKARELKQKSRDVLDRLARKTGSDYERAYLDAVVEGHGEALALLAQMALPAATTTAVKAHLEQALIHGTAHLEKARALQRDKHAEVE